MRAYDSLFENHKDDAVNKLFDLVAKKEREKHHLENKISEVKKLLLKGKAEEALQIILMEEKQ